MSFVPGSAHPRGRILRAGLTAAVLAAALSAAAASAHAQRSTGGVDGRVVDATTAAPLIGVRITVEGTSIDVATAADGRFRVPAVPAGERVLVFEHIGRRTLRRTVVVRAGETTRIGDVALVEVPISLDDVIVSVTGEAQELARTTATVGAVDGGAIRERRPTHPSEVLDEIPGVWVNVTGGEGHMTAIRQPLTTEAVYLFAEDGVPTRSTGFFNHNALYEINLPQADGIEVVKGPSTALYGSDAIGGVINVETRSAAADPGFEATVEGGAYGWARLLASYAAVGDDGGAADGIRVDANVTRTGGWREATEYDRQSATLRWDRELGAGSSLKTVATASRIDQRTAGSSRLPEDLYRSDPTRNLTPISFREVEAVRVSTEYERRGEATLVTITPFARHNSMEMLPNWSLTYDPAVWRTANRSLGILARVRRDFARMDARLIAGLDIDWSPGEHFERVVDPVRVDGTFTDYSAGDPIYDYDVAFTGVSPYLHAEASPVSRLRLTAGLRLDRLAYAYENRLGVLRTGAHRRPASTNVSFLALSPKLGAAVDLGAGTSAFVAFGRGFRAPSEGQLFRQGVAANTVTLEPIRADNYELGLRGRVGDRLSYQLAAYRMRKTNDILDFQRADDQRETQNAGATLHRGIEAGFGAELPGGLRINAGASYARHSYEAWSPAEGVDYAGHEMEAAPRTIGNAALSYAPPMAEGARLALEWTHLGGYWLDAENTERYGGHDLLGLRASWPFADRFTVYGKIDNLMDAHYAESAALSRVRGPELAPGMPRTIYAGLEMNLGGGQ